MRLYIFGAGASAGTLGLPAARDFGLELARAKPRWRRAYPHLARVVEGLRQSGETESWDLADAWTRLDYLTKLAWAVDLGGDLAEANVEMRKALLDVYGRTGARVRRNGHKSQTVRTLLRKARPGDVVVSFNYDLLVEQVAAEAGVHLVQAPCERCRGKHRCVQLVKPHGSLAWRVERLDGQARVRWRSATGEPLLRALSNHQVSERLQPLVLGVVPIKSELLREVEEAHHSAEVHEAIVRQWRAAVDAARRADEIAVVGYSFPPEDQYGSFLFYEATRSRRQKPVVAFYELEASAFEVARRLVEVFGVWPTWRRPV